MKDTKLKENVKSVNSKNQNEIIQMSEVVGCSITTVAKLLRDAGIACGRYHDKTVKNVTAQNIQLDEIWSFCYAKQK